MKKTSWFSAAKDKPTRVGMYEIGCTMSGAFAHDRFRHWDGKQWAKPERGAWVVFCDEWRGLTTRNGK